MAPYECPCCGGGFPDLPPEEECPWCGTQMDGEYSNRRQYRVRENGEYMTKSQTVPHAHRNTTVQRSDLFDR